MDFRMDLEEFYMTMDHSIKVVLTMVLQNANRLYLFGLMVAFLEVEFDKIKLTDMANYQPGSFFTKDYGRMIYQMEKQNKFILPLHFFKANL